ncbi:MAG: hypothetical protein WC967_13230 [Balneolaceae bacterium]
MRSEVSIVFKADDSFHVFNKFNKEVTSQLEAFNSLWYSYNSQDYIEAPLGYTKHSGNIKLSDIQSCKEINGTNYEGFPALTAFLRDVVKIGNKPFNLRIRNPSYLYIYHYDLTKGKLSSKRVQYYDSGKRFCLANGRVIKYSSLDVFKFHRTGLYCELITRKGIDKSSMFITKVFARYRKLSKFRP